VRFQLRRASCWRQFSIFSLRGTSYRLPANAHANPIPFAGRDGRQYVVIAAGGGGFSRDLSRTVSDTVLAFALPR